MLHFPGESLKLLNMSRDQKKKYLKEIDLSTIDFEIKIADFGFSKKIRHRS
jgi:hypothetical protein